MRRAAQFEVVNGRRPTIGERDAVVVLEPGRLGAPAFGPDEGASIAVACADCATEMRGDIARAGIGGPRRSRSIRPSVLHFFELLNQHSQCTVDDRRFVGAAVREPQ